MKFRTETGSVYEYHDPETKGGMGKLKRVNPDGPLRGDDSFVDVVSTLGVKVGESAVFLLDGLAPEGPTVRITSRVVEKW